MRKFHTWSSTNGRTMSFNESYGPLNFVFQFRKGLPMFGYIAVRILGHWVRTSWGQYA